MKEKRDEIIILRTTKTEKNRIYEKMLGMGIRSLSAYIRKMALDGYCLNLDLPQLRRMAYLLQMCSNNLNQYAKAANENGRVYAADMEDLRQRLDELIDIGRQILSRLAELGYSHCQRRRSRCQWPCRPGRMCRPLCPRPGCRSCRHSCSSSRRPSGRWC